MQLSFFDLEITTQEEIKNSSNIQMSHKTQTGDIYKLGRHYLMCGDSTDERNYKKLLGNQKIDLVFTDPPYGMGKEKEGVANDNLNSEVLLEFNKKWIPITIDYLKKTGSWYCWGNDAPLMDIYANIIKPLEKQRKCFFRNLFVWDKGDAPGMNWEMKQKYVVATEKCLFAQCGICKRESADDFLEELEPIRSYLASEAKMFGLNFTKYKQIFGAHMYKHYFTKSQWNFISEKDYKKLQQYYSEQKGFAKEYSELKKEYEKAKINGISYFNNTHDIMHDVWNFKRVTGEERCGHATPKPIELCERAIKTSSRENEIVFDGFGGIGSTLIACENLHRICYMMELEPKWVDVIVERWEKFTGQKAELISKNATNATP